MVSPRSFSTWNYLGLAVVPTMITALPTAGDIITTGPGGFRVRGRAPDLRYVVARDELTGEESADSDDEADDDASSDEEDARPPAGRPPPSSKLPASASAIAAPARSGGDVRREHAIIAAVSVASVVFLVFFCFLLWKFRAVIARKTSRRQPPNRNDFEVPPEKDMHGEPVITAPVGAWLDPSPTSDDIRKSALFGAPTSVTGTEDYRAAVFNMPYPPPPALAPSTVGLERGEIRQQQLVRRSLLDEAGRRRLAGSPADSEIFYLEDEHNNEGLHPTPPLAPVGAQRKTKRDSLSLAIQVPEDESGGVAKFETEEPASPDATKTSNRYSWVTPQDAGRTVRSSMESQPAKFRSVNSWVSNVASRTAKGKHSGAGSEAGTVPPTPVEFRQHPGAEVRYGGGPRIESRVLDMRLDARSWV